MSQEFDFKKYPYFSDKIGQEFARGTFVSMEDVKIFCFWSFLVAKLSVLVFCNLDFLLHNTVARKQTNHGQIFEFTTFCCTKLNDKF